jgi:uncharacterized protein YbjT (DUF2867 family)
MTDQTPSPRRTAPAGGVLVTAASGTLGRAVVAALDAAGLDAAGFGAAGFGVVAGMPDPRAWLADGARRASGTAAGLQPDGAGPPGRVRPGAKPLRAPNRKPEKSLAAKPAARSVAKPARTANTTPAAASGTAVAAAAARTGVAVRALDFADQSTWSRALAGVDRVVLIVPDALNDVGRTVIPFIDQAMEEAGVRQIVFLGSPGAPLDARSPTRLVERYLERTRAPHTILRPSILMQSLTTRFRDDIRSRGEIVVPAAGGTAPFVDADDVGRAVAAVLGEPGGEARHLGKTYTLAGEERFGFAQVAELLTAVLGRTIRYTAIGEGQYLELAAKQGVPAAEAQALAARYRRMRRSLPGLPSRGIRRLTGRPATSLPDFVERHRQTWL